MSSRDTSIHLCFDWVIRGIFCHRVPMTTHVGRNVKIKSSVRCLTRAFLAVETLTLLQSTTNYRPRSLTRNENTGRRLSYRPVESGRRPVSPSVDHSTTPYHLRRCLHNRDQTDDRVAHRPPASSTRKDYRIGPPPKVPPTPQNIPLLLRDDRRFHVEPVRMTLCLLPLACP